MTSTDGSHNLNRAICNAAGDAERAELDTTIPNTQRTAMMQAVFLSEYAKVCRFLSSNDNPRAPAGYSTLKENFES